MRPTVRQPPRLTGRVALVLTFDIKVSMSSASLDQPKNGRKRIELSSFGMAGTSKDSIQASSSAPPHNAPASQSSEHGERQPPRRDKSNDIDEIGPITARQQMSKAGVLFQGEHTMERNGLIIEELSDFNNDNEGDDRSNTMQPDDIESADSDQSEPRGATINDLQNLNITPLSSWSDSDMSDNEHQEAIRQRRAYGLKKLRSITKSSNFKRTMSERNDSDSEGSQHKLHPDQVGSSARRLRRRIGIRQSLMFEDPPPKIDEMDESLEELQDIEMLKKELPFYALTTMDPDSPSTLTYNVLQITSSSFQKAEDKDCVSEEKESFHASSSYGMESESPQNIGENSKLPTMRRTFGATVVLLQMRQCPSSPTRIHYSMPGRSEAPRHLSIVTRKHWSGNMWISWFATQDSRSCS